MRPPSQKWGYVRIITGTIVGGILGFYVMHRVENNYKKRMNERLEQYEAELLKKRSESMNEQEESHKLNVGCLECARKSPQLALILKIRFLVTIEENKWRKGRRKFGEGVLNEGTTRLKFLGGLR